MYRIILNGTVPNLLKQVNPFGYFCKKISEDDCLSVLPGISPSFSDALQSGLFSGGLQFRQDVELVRTAKVNITFIVTT